jgi:poly-gamma-glutamate synthesis protein (capsule biosynthesis protein)
MKEAVRQLRPSVDVLIVAFHKGIVHTPVTLAMYERPLAEAAIDAGADVVVGHHAHILKGVEVYQGKPIFHGLGNFVTVTRQLSVDPNANPSPERLAWAKRRKALFNFEPDPDYPLYPFHPEAKNTIIATCVVGKDGVISAGFIPCYVKPNGEPEVLGNDERGREVASYVERISRDAGLETRFSWKGDQVVIQ